MATLKLTDMIKGLRNVSRALNDVEVKGRDNLNILLGSMQAIDQVAAALEQSLAEFEPKPAAKNEPEIKLEVVPVEEESEQ